jgi:hypothetical protein
METEYAGAPVDGGTFPAEIWHDVVLAYESIIGSAEAENEDDTSTDDTGGYAPPTTAPAAPDAPAAPVEPAPEPAPTAPAPTGGGGGAPAPAPTGGGTGATGASR